MRALIFDDDAATCHAMTRVVAAVGIQATGVSDAEAFRNSLQSNPPDLILLDLHLGPTDGVEQIRLLANQSFPGSIILISGYDDRILDSAASLAKSWHLHTEAVFRKPIDFDALRRVLMLRQVRELRPKAPGQTGPHGAPPSAEKVLAAIADEQISIVLQPIVSRHPQRLRKLEALVRWDHPLLGRITPDEFVPVAESDDACITALTDRVIDLALAAQPVLRQGGVNAPIAVNLSARSLLDAAFPDRLDERLRAAGLPGSQLCVEITESAAVRDPEDMRAILLRLRLQGIEVAIDDFGTGHSSLIALRRLPFSEIKIDRSFVADIAEAHESFAIVKSIIGLAREIGVTTVAEGVETEWTAQFLEELGVDAMQGYLFAKPMTVEAIPTWYAGWTAAS